MQDNCKLSMEANNIEEYFNSIHKENDNPWNFWDSEYEQTKYIQQIQLVKDHIKPTNILEIGCSTGAHTVIIRNHFPDATITAVDISEAAVERAKLNTAGDKAINFIVSDVFDFLQSQKDSNYDAVFWAETFDQLHKVYTFDKFIDLVKILRELMQNNSMLCISHITAKNNSYKKLDTPKMVLDSYHTIISEIFNKTLEATYLAHKEENECAYEYKIFLY